jgi:ectoine hydroxylase-related dioxygenase (phytanoyl-CoA dioxygenase family)
MSEINTSQLKQHYEQDGYVIVPNVIDTDLVKEGQAHIDWLQKQYPHLRPEQFNHELVTRDAFWVRLVSDERLLDVVEQFIGPNIGLFASHYIAKPPRTGKSVPWHQDGSYWPLDPMEVITVWLALDRSDDENGCLRVIPGTQHETLLPTEDMVRQNEGSAFDIGMDAEKVDVSQAISLILNPGDISIHHSNIVHGSEPNTSPRWRRGLTIRYIPTSTRITKEKPHHAAFILRGSGFANGNGWNLLPAYQPESSMPFAGQAAWNEKCAAKNAKYEKFLAQPA